MCSYASFLSLSLIEYVSIKCIKLSCCVDHFIFNDTPNAWNVIGMKLFERKETFKYSYLCIMELLETFLWYYLSFMIY